MSCEERELKMINVNKVRDPRGEKQREADEARIEELEALLDYVAMMADVDLPEWEEGEGDE